MNRTTRECGCPEWVDRCIHFGNKLIILPKQGTKTCGPIFYVTGWVDYKYIIRDNSPAISQSGVCDIYYQGDDPAAALAVFEEAEKRLLGI